jgi:hypothetical protein
MKKYIWIYGLFFSVSVLGQKVIQHEISAQGDIVIAPDISIPKINNGYTLWLPESEAVQGLIVFTHARRDTVKSEFLIDYALENKLGVLYATTDNRLEFYFQNDRMQEIENYIQEVIQKYLIPKDKLLFCGMSLEGTRALKQAIYGQSAASQHQIVPRAIAICDAPLDMVRFYKEMVKAKELNFMPITGSEGNWVSQTLYHHLGGIPRDTLSAYIAYSPYCYMGDGGLYLHEFDRISIRAYTEPDVNWWIETRGKDYYGMNAIDLAGFINGLKLEGHPDAELITTQDQGYFPDGTRHPHSWSIVDEKDLIDWFVRLIVRP